MILRLYFGRTHARSLKWKSSSRGCQAERVYMPYILLHSHRILVFYVNILWSGSRTPSWRRIHYKFVNLCIYIYIYKGREGEHNIIYNAGLSFQMVRYIYIYR